MIRQERSESTVGGRPNRSANPRSPRGAARVMPEGAPALLGWVSPDRSDRYLLRLDLA
jgi:hypothetical protein